jgi:hypothetical protein
MHKEGGTTVETPIEARAGFLDRPTLAVLIVSTCLIAGVFALILHWFLHGVMFLGRKRDRGPSPFSAEGSAIVAVALDVLGFLLIKFGEFIARIAIHPQQLIKLACSA